MTAPDRYLEASRHDAPIRLGLISNPMARTNWRSVAHERLLPLLDTERLGISTPSVGHLSDAVARLLFDEGCNVLAVNGGDGTIHATINAVIDAVQAAGADMPLPRFLLLNGGGMNMLARTFDTRGHPRRTVSRFQRHARGRSVGALKTRLTPMLEVHEPDGTVRRGFIFGSETVMNALTMYERFGQGYRGLGRFLVEVAAGMVWETDQWAKWGHLLSAPWTSVTVDGEEVPEYMAVVASTVPLTLMLGLIATVPRPPNLGTLEGLVITETDPNRVISLIPSLMFGTPSEQVRSLAGARRVDLHGPYTLDGERFARLDSHAPLTVRASEQAIRGIWLE